MQFAIVNNRVCSLNIFLFFVIFSFFFFRRYTALFSVTFTWILGHINFPGYDAVDLPPKQSLKSSSNSEPLPTPAYDLETYYHSLINNTWDQFWSSQTSNTLRTKAAEPSNLTGAELKPEPLSKVRSQSVFLVPRSGRGSRALPEPESRSHDSGAFAHDHVITK